MVSPFVKSYDLDYYMWWQMEFSDNIKNTPKSNQIYLLARLGGVKESIRPW